MTGAMPQAWCAGGFAAPVAGAALSGLITRVVTLDLFDSLQRVTFRERVSSLRDGG